MRGEYAVCCYFNENMCSNSSSANETTASVRDVEIYSAAEHRTKNYTRAGEVWAYF